MSDRRRFRFKKGDKVVVIDCASYLKGNKNSSII